MLKKLTVLLVLILALSGCTAQTAPDSARGMEIVGSMELLYAKQFSVDYLAGGCAMITINGSERFLLVPEGAEAPIEQDADVTILRQPVQNVYLAATSVMCLFDALDSLGHITMSGTQADGWYIENARAAMERGDIVYAGKYSAPDYELLLSGKCGLAIESTMITHTPEVAEKLEVLGIPVLVERSSYETHPLGRTEWLKLYGLLCGKTELAEKLFDEQVAYLDSVSSENTGKTVAFFYISSTGNVVARKSGDYTVKMIELAGGTYVFSDLGDPDSATGSVNLEMERFYNDAKDADIIVYNSSIDGEVRTLAELLAKSPLLADFKAVQNGDVWCTSKNLFQETTGFGLMIADMNRIFTGELDGSDSLNYIYKLR